MKEIETTWPAGIKRTKQRVCVLSILEHADSPLSAMEICKRTERENCPVWLSTVYRILELFIKENMVAKTMLSDSEMALYSLNREPHKHYAVCLKCHKVLEIDTCALENFIPQLSARDFQITGHKLEMYGYCKDCKNKTKTD